MIGKSGSAFAVGMIAISGMVFGIGASTGSAGTPGEGIGKMYWTTVSRERIQRANLDGTAVETYPFTGLNRPEAIAVDPVGGKLYWSDRETDLIVRTNLDGSGHVDFLVGTAEVGPLTIPRELMLGDVLGLALDVPGGKMYWTDWRARRVQRANLDGTDIETLVTKETIGQNFPTGIDLDLSGGKMYWTGYDTGTGIGIIRRANLDGSGVEDLFVTGTGIPRAIALDVAGGKMYWADRGTGKILRANLNGAGVEDLVTGLTQPIGIDLDIAAGKVYWADEFAHKIQRANLDGTAVEDLVVESRYQFKGFTLIPSGEGN